MLKLAKVTSTDVVYDLGSGDGRIPMTAAKVYGARGVGIDIDPERIRGKRTPMPGRRVRQGAFLDQDLFKVDISEATVVTLFLTPSLNARLSKVEPGAQARHARRVAPVGDEGREPGARYKPVPGGSSRAATSTSGRFQLEGRRCTIAQRTCAPARVQVKVPKAIVSMSLTLLVMLFSGGPHAQAPTAHSGHPVCADAAGGRGCDAQGCEGDKRRRRLRSGLG